MEEGSISIPREMNPEIKNYTKEQHPPPFPSHRIQGMPASHSVSDEERFCNGTETSEGEKKNSVIWMQFPTHPNREAAPLTGGGRGDPSAEHHRGLTSEVSSLSPSLQQPWQEHESQLSRCVHQDASSGYAESIPSCSSQVDRRSEQFETSANFQGSMSANSLSEGIKELSAGLTFRRTTRGYYLYWNDNQELVFLDEANNLHKLDDGYDTEESAPRGEERVLSSITSDANVQKIEKSGEENSRESTRSRERSEPSVGVLLGADIADEARKEANRMHQLDLLVIKQLELLNSQCRQYQQYLHQAAQYSQLPQQQQHYDQYRQCEQQLTSQQLELLQHLSQVMRSSPAEKCESFVSLVGNLLQYIQKNNPTERHQLREILLHIREKENQLCSLYLKAEHELRQSQYPLFQGNDVNRFQQHLQDMYQHQYQSWNQFLQTAREQRQLVDQLQQECCASKLLGQGDDTNDFSQQNLQNPDRREQCPEQGIPPPSSSHSKISVTSTSQLDKKSEQMARVSQTQRSSQNQISVKNGPTHGDVAPKSVTNELSTPLIIPDSRLQGQEQELRPSSPLSQPRLQASLSGSSLTSRPQFSGRFDAHRRPIYIDSSGSYFRLNASRQPEYLLENELPSLSLTKK